jgi:hypothetical protein
MVKVAIYPKDCVLKLNAVCAGERAVLKFPRAKNYVLSAKEAAMP